jgi:Tol biopolymer transport system component
MNRHVIAMCGAFVLGTALMLSADASPDSEWSEWSTPVNLGAGINTPFSDGSPAISQDGLTLYFNSNRPGVPPDAFGDADLYVARRERVDLPWGAPANLGDTINTAGFEGFPALSRNEHHLFFVRSPGDIWISYRKDVHDDFGDSGWQTPVPLGPGVNTSNSEQGPSYFENRKRGLPQLFFHSLRPRVPGEPANIDIYVADAFGPAVLVNELSSDAVDARPSITANGLEIFFHSNRPDPGGMGGFDMYTSVRKSVLESWSPPRPLGSIVNTAASDFLGYISPDGESLFFTSTRDGGFGSNDIYVTTRTKHGRR